METQDFDWLTYYFKNTINQEFLQYTDYYNDRLRNCKKILIVEDDLISFEIIQSFIKDYDPESIGFLASCEQDAIDILKTHGCDLVIADYFLDSNQTGLRLCQKIKDKYPDVVCTIVSSLKRHQFQEILNYSNMEPDFFEKPLSKKQILGYLNEFYSET